MSIFKIIDYIYSYICFRQFIFYIFSSKIDKSIEMMIIFLQITQPDKKWKYKPGSNVVNFTNFINCEGQPYNGDKTETISFAYKPDGVEEFWSITRYSVLTRNTLPGRNDVYNAYNTRPDENGNITISFSSEDPQDGTYWMPVIGGEPYYFVVRYYGADLNNLPHGPCE